MSEGPQEAFYDEHQDYWSGSPHLKHRHLNATLIDLIFRGIDAATEADLPRDVLEIGGGDGSITEPLLANGLEVTSTEMSAASVAAMQRRFRRSDRFRVVHDPDGSLAVVGDARFSCILFASVLHHIPDYMAAISHACAGHLRPGGSLVTIQDPLWYPRMSNTVRKASSGAFLSWRIFQGNLVRGVGTRVRRASRGLSEDEPGDTVEYHVVRNGVDDRAIAEQLRRSFESVEIHPYWSTQGALQQRLGEAAGAQNTFAVLARGFRPQD